MCSHVLSKKRAQGAIFSICSSLIGDQKQPPQSCLCQIGTPIYSESSSSTLPVALTADDMAPREWNKSLLPASLYQSAAFSTLAAKPTPVVPQAAAVAPAPTPFRQV